MRFSEVKEILGQKTVGIAGAGGLGSNCTVALIRCGLGKVIVSDFDIVSEENLNRQYFFHDQIGEKKVFALKNNIHKINSLTEVVVHDIRLNSVNIPEIYRKCDVIIEAFDLAEMKQMIIETVLEKLPNTPLICGIGLAGYGMNTDIGFRKYGNLYICGDEKNEVSEDNPPLAPRVGMVSMMQANTALEILLG